MLVLNKTTRAIFVGVKDRRLQSVEGLRQGVRFPASASREVPDELRLSKDFDEEVIAGRLEIVSFSSDPTSTVQQEELSSGGVGVAGLVEAPFTPTLGQTLFLLPVDYKTGGFARVLVNTLWYTTPSFFSITGGVMLWLDVGFSLDTSDDILVWYEEDTP